MIESCKVDWEHYFPPYESTSWAVWMLDIGQAVRGKSWPADKYIKKGADGKLYSEDGERIWTLVFNTEWELWDDTPPKTKPPHDFKEGELILFACWGKYLKATFIRLSEDPEAISRGAVYMCKHDDGTITTEEVCIPFEDNERREGATVRTNAGRIHRGYRPPCVDAWNARP